MSAQTEVALGKMIFRKTNSQTGRHIAVTPENSTMRHLSYGRIILNSSRPSVSNLDERRIVTGPEPVAFTMTAAAQFFGSESGGAFTVSAVCDFVTCSFAMYRALAATPLSGSRRSTSRSSITPFSQRPTRHSARA